MQTVIKKVFYAAKDNGVCLLKDILLYYTFLSVLFKSIIFLGFIIDENHTKSNLIAAYHDVPLMGVYICFILVVLSFSFLFRGRARLWFHIAFNLVFSLLFLFDMWYYRGFGTLLSLHLLEQTANLDNMSGSILSMARPMDIIFIFDIAALFIIALLNKNPYKKMNRNVFVFLITFVLCVGYISYTHYKVDVIEQGKKQILFRICWTPNQTISNLSPIGYHIYDTYTYWKECQPVVLKPEQKNRIKQWLEDKKENLPDNKYKSLFKGKNLLVIQVESLENFVINQKINNQEITPNINRLLKNSLYFSNYYEQVYNGTSADAELMINTSVYPVRRGSTFFRYPNNTYNSLPKLLQNSGYSTLAVHADKGAFWNWVAGLTGIGFQKCIDSGSFNIDERIGLGLSDGSFFRQVEPVVVKQKQPFYTFLITLTSHGPFDISDTYRELKLDENLDRTKLGNYFQCIHYVDKHIGLFLDQLKKDGVLDNTVVVIYGDHTGVHKYYQDELNLIQPSEDWWLKQDKRIPLIIYSNGLQGEEIKITAGQIDTFPTIAYLMGADEENYSGTVMGRNLLKTEKDFVVLANKEYVGTKGTEKEVNEAIEGIGIADDIITSDYFKEALKVQK